MIRLCRIFSLTIVDSTLTRRRFAGFLSALTGADLWAATPLPVAIQLFSLRKQCEEDLEGTLSYVRQVGFNGVELAGFYGRTAPQLRDLLSRNSLKICGSHTPLQQLSGGNFEQTVTYNQILQNHNLIVPGLPKEYEQSSESWKQAANRLNEIAEKLRPLGMRIGYHNHDVEFRPLDGVLPWAVLYENTRPDVILQLDTGNARVGGADPTNLIRQYPGRALTVHVKDYLPGHLDPVLGSSNFDWPEFLKTCRTRGGTEWYIIEHDSPHREEAKVCFDAFERFQS